MTVSEVTALIGAVTALITAVTALARQLRHERSCPLPEAGKTPSRAS